jgi:glycosyltransferase involved in cell wall biosynthesis
MSSQLLNSTKSVRVPFVPVVAQTEPTQKGSALPRLLAVSFCYPPSTEPRAIQVSRLLKHLNAGVTLACAAADDSQSAGLGDTESFLQNKLCVPFVRSGWHRFMERVASRIPVPVWGRTPDGYISWKRAVSASVSHHLSVASATSAHPEILITFAFPLIDHVIGLELKRRYGFPWLAHFSDPWTDNAFKKDDQLTRRLNLSLERKVIGGADRLVFTSEETANLVMAKYPDELSAKVTIIPHAFEPNLFSQSPKLMSDGFVIRYLGDFYQQRTPKPLFDGLKKLLDADPELLRDVRFEIVGTTPEGDLDQMGLKDLPAGLVQLKQRVDYIESLSLMTSADGLMVIDAPARESVFLPSKLIEYVGAARPIIGMTPPGAAANLIARLGGWVADPSDPHAVAHSLRAFVSFLKSRKNQAAEPWGVPEVRREFEAGAVAEQFARVLREMRDRS